MAIVRAAEAEILHLREAAAHLLAICSDVKVANRYFKIVEKDELSKNEFNLNLPRYIQTYNPEESIDLGKSMQALTMARSETQSGLDRVRKAMEMLGVKA